MGLRRRKERTDSWKGVGRNQKSHQQRRVFSISLFCHEDSAEKSKMAQPAGFLPGRLLSAGVCRGIHRQEPEKSWCRHDRPDAITYLGRSLVERRTIAAHDRKNEEERQSARVWAEHESLGAHERFARSAGRVRRCRSGNLQHFRSEPGGCPVADRSEEHTSELQ